MEKTGERQFTERWEEQMFGKEMFDKPGEVYFLYTKSYLW